jgi:hypothetical protein
MTIAALFLIALPIYFNVVFALLSQRFDYPGILRRPAGEILASFAAGGTPLVRLWWAFMLSALLFVPTAVLVARHLPGADGDILQLGLVCGVLAGVVQTLGLARWPFAMPELARLHAAARTAQERAASETIFAALHRYLGVAVGEHLGYLLTAAWTALVAVAVVQSDVVPAALGWAGIGVAVALTVGAREFVGRHEQHGWRPAETLVPVAYVVWSLWMVALGIALLLA